MGSRCQSGVPMPPHPSLSLLDSTYTTVTAEWGAKHNTSLVIDLLCVTDPTPTPPPASLQNSRGYHLKAFLTGLHPLWTGLWGHASQPTGHPTLCYSNSLRPTSFYLHIFIFPSGFLFLEGCDHSRLNSEYSLKSCSEGRRATSLLPLFLNEIILNLNGKWIFFHLVSSL